MWLVIAYDFPSENSAEYRRFRKSLLKHGFIFVQKSLCWRWVHSSPKAGSLRKKVESSIRGADKILVWELSDLVFGSASRWNNGTASEMPDPPLPWTII